MIEMDCNDFSIGIELEGCIDEEFTDEQYKILKAVILKLKEEYGIIHTVGHSDIAPDRKVDPGPLFNWDKLLINTLKNTQFNFVFLAYRCYANFVTGAALSRKLWLLSADVSKEIGLLSLASLIVALNFFVVTLC